MSTETLNRRNDFDVAGEERIYRSLRHFWHPIAYAADVGDGPVGATLCGQDLVAVRLGGEVCVFEDLCAHRGTRLSLGRVRDGCQLECPYHGWRYDADGECVLAPQRPDLASHLRARVRRYEAVERYGLIWTCLADRPRFPLADYPAWDIPRCHHLPVRADDWECSAPRRVENYTDYSHLAIVHDGFLGDREEPEIPGHRVWREEERGLLHCRQDEDSWTRVALGSDEGLGGRSDGSGGYMRYRTDWTLSMPLTIGLTVTLEDGGSYHLLFHPTPIGPKRTRNFTIASRDFGDPADDEREVADFERLIYEQDRPVVESQRPEQLPEDLSEEMHLKGVDTFSIEYRRWLAELAAGLVEDSGEGEG